MKKLLLLFIVLLYGSLASADAIDMRDYIKLRRGMSEAEVLYRLGSPDHETSKKRLSPQHIAQDLVLYTSTKSSDKWITEIEFDSNGRIINLDRDRINK